MTTAPMLRQKTHGGSAVGIGSSDSLASLCSEQLAEHVESRGLGHTPLLPSVDGALAHTAQLAELTGSETELLACGADAGSVVEELAVVAEDDGYSVGAGCMVDGDAHGSIFDVVGGRNGLAVEDNRTVGSAESGALKPLPDIADKLGVIPRTGRINDVAGIDQRRRLIGADAKILGGKLDDLRTHLGQVCGQRPDVAAIVLVAPLGKKHDVLAVSGACPAVGEGGGRHAPHTAHVCAVVNNKLRKFAQSGFYKAMTTQQHPTAGRCKRCGAQLPRLWL